MDMEECGSPESIVCLCIAEYFKVSEQSGLQKLSG